MEWLWWVYFLGWLWFTVNEDIGRPVLGRAVLALFWPIFVVIGLMAP